MALPSVGMVFVNADFLLPVRVVDPFCPGALFLSSAAHGSGAGMETSYKTFLRPVGTRNCCIPNVVSLRVAQIEDDSEEGRRRSWRGSLSDERRRGGKAGSLSDTRREKVAGARTLPWRRTTGESYPSKPFNLNSQKQTDDGHRVQFSPFEAKFSCSASLSASEKEANKNGSTGSSLENTSKFYHVNTTAPSFFRGNTFRIAPWQQADSKDFRTSEPNRDPDEEGTRRNLDKVFDEMESKHCNDRKEKSAMQRIVEKLRSIESIDKAPKKKNLVGELQRSIARQSGSSFLPKQGEDLFSISKNWSTPDHPVPEPGKGILETRFPWESDKETETQEKAEKEKRVTPPSLAELTIPRPELSRLRKLSLQLTSLLKIGKLGVTDNIAESIQERWRTCEVVKVKCEGPPALNMKKTHEDLERKTGGLVIWRAGSAAVVYRGKHYGQPIAGGEGWTSQTKLEKAILSQKNGQEFKNYGEDDLGGGQSPQKETETGDPVTNLGGDSAIGESKASEPFIETEYEKEIESILEDLGPRFKDWAGRKPVPVDGDLLPAIVPDYKPPFRLLPYGVKPKLSNTELTNLRRLARPLSPHFVLGRNKGLQGLAAAVVKLWEKSEIARIAVKRGVQNTSNERMAEELKYLTGGVLISRDKYFITFYRGKDFLPRAVAAALADKEASTRTLQEEEERARAETSIPVLVDTELKLSTSATSAEVLESKATWQMWLDSKEQQKLRVEAAKAKQLEHVRMIERKLAVALAKKGKAEKELTKVEQFLKPADPPVDQETITEEERFMFRKLGQRMKAFLLLGRRGVFDGVVENMHLHWKHRELVKIILKERDPIIAQETARMLEYESGGILVAIVPTSKGQAIIVYRGKNYQRPAQLRPRNLLTKRKALKRSLEIQRHGALAKHILGLEKEINKLKTGLHEIVGKGNSKVPQEMQDKSDIFPQDGFQQNNDRAAVNADSEERTSRRDTAEVGTIELQETALSFEGVKTKDISEADFICRVEALTTKERQGAVIKLGSESSSVRNTHEVGTIELQEAPLTFEGVKANDFSEAEELYIAEPLTTKEKLQLRKQALKMRKAAHFHVGKSNLLEGLSKAIQVYFKKHALVKVGVKGRARGTSIQELIHGLEEATGAVLVSQESSKIILYRGWPDGEEKPSSGFDEELPPELLAALKEEDAYWIEGVSSKDSFEEDSFNDIAVMAEETDGLLKDREDSTENGVKLLGGREHKKEDGSIDIKGIDYELEKHEETDNCYNMNREMNEFLEEDEEEATLVYLDENGHAEVVGG